MSDITHDVWEFSDGESTYKVRMIGNRASNDGDLVRRWCVAGKGLAVKSCLDMASDLLAGRVVSLMPAFRPRRDELWLILPSRQSITPATRLLRGFLEAQCTNLQKRLVEQGFLDPGTLG